MKTNEVRQAILCINNIPCQWTRNYTVVNHNT